MLPNLVICGAMKAGTTSLHYYLNLHPEIFMCDHKELNFFCKNLAWKKGLRWYKSNFKSGNEKIYGESFPHYSQYPIHKKVPEIMHSVLPKAKLIYIIRNPINRMISNYLHRFREHYEERQVEEALTNRNDRYIQFSKYFMQIEEYLKFYKREQILIVKNRNLREKRIETLKKIFKFLEVDSSFRCDEFYKMKNVSEEKRKYPKHKKAKRIVRYLRGKAPFVPKAIKKKMYPNLGPGELVEKPTLSKEAKKRILSYLREDIERMQVFSGLNLSDWLDEGVNKIS